MKGKKWLKRIAKIVIFFLILGITFYLALLFLPQKISVTHYNVETDHFFKGNNENDCCIRVVQLTDLHNEEFGRDNKRLIKKVEDQNPDCIIMTGDMINREDQNLSIIKNLISKLSDIAPVYFSYGNHETTWEKNFGEKLHDELAEAGAIVLNDEYLDIQIKDVPVRIGGFRGYYGYTHMDGQTAEQKVEDQQFFNDFVDTDRMRILLNHIPTQWVDWNRIDDWHTGLVFSGHYHGGQIVLPGIGPLIAPYVGWFPEHVKGCYQGKTSTCVLSSGLGNEHPFIPRFMNPPEIVVADIRIN